MASHSSPSTKSMEKSENKRLISPIACSLNRTSSRAYVRGKKRVHTASIKNKFFDFANPDRCLNSAWLRAAGFRDNVMNKMNSLISLVVNERTFSTKTCFPASRAFLASSNWRKALWSEATIRWILLHDLCGAFRYRWHRRSVPETVYTRRVIYVTQYATIVKRTGLL